MACEVTWTRAAHDDVDRAVRYIAVNLASPQAASSLLDAFERAVDEIAAFPEACAVGTHPSLASRGLRKKVVRRYVILYSFDGESAVISRVFHSLQAYVRIIEDI